MIITDTSWIDVDCIISIVNMSYIATNKVYTLDRIDVEDLEKFMTETNV